ncbi:MAG: xylulokinase [Acidimicrobiia bacterium]
MALVLGVDSSTQATKVQARDSETGELLAAGRAPHPPTTPPRSEQDPHIWWDAMGAAVEHAGVAARDVVAVSVAGQQHGMVTLDAHNHVVRPAKLWNDTESAADARWLIDQLAGSEAEWARRCGSVPVAAFTITKLSWLHRCEPDAWARVARVCLPHDWITWKLADEFVTDRGDASGTGYFSAAHDAYQLDLLALVDDGVDWSTRLPRVLGPIEPAGMTQTFGSNTVVAPGTGDNMAAAVALGLEPGDVAISLGTSGTVFTVSESATADPTGAVAGFADATGRYLPLVCTLNATKVTDTIAGWLGVDHAGLDSLALSAPPGANGVVVVPYFDGERTPNRPGASGTVVGLRNATTREDLARAAIEGVVCGLLDGVDALTDTGVRTDGDIVLVGGGARSVAYQRVLADLSGRRVIVPDASEHVAAGACIQAAAVVRNEEMLDVARAWGLAHGPAVQPNVDVDGAAVRAAYTDGRG